MREQRTTKESHEVANKLGQLCVVGLNGDLEESEIDSSSILHCIFDEIDIALTSTLVHECPVVELAYAQKSIKLIGMIEPQQIIIFFNANITTKKINLF